MLRVCIVLMMLSASLTFVAAGERDARADELADKVMAAMGGQENYDATRFITWKFFGSRLHVWDKWTGRLHYNNGKDLTVLMNVNTQEGKAWKAGEPIEDEAALKEALTGGYRAWINDSYWLVMPYKLKDPGVTLTYSGEGEMTNGRPAWILTLTFDNVGVTPQNKYDVYIDKERNLVEEWAFYTKADDPEPRFKTPWADWKPYGKIMLSEDRGQRGHTGVAVFDELPDSVFTSPVAPVFPGQSSE